MISFDGFFFKKSVKCEQLKVIVKIFSKLVPRPFLALSTFQHEHTP